MRGSAVFRTGVAPGGALAGPWVQNPLWARARAVPSLDLRFADNKSLVDAVTGASLVTFTRASDGAFVDSAGARQTAATNVPCFDHNPTTGESLGLLIEEQRTNSIRNNTMVGAVAGTPGTLPTNWTSSVGSGILLNVIGTGTESDITYIDAQFVGTSTASGQVSLRFEGTATMPASAATVYTGSCYVRTVAGSTANVNNVIQQLVARNSGGSNIGEQTTSMTSSLSASSIRINRQANTFTTPALTTSIQHDVRIDFSNAVAINITLRIGLPQLEQGAFVTSPILTSTAAATRSASLADLISSAIANNIRSFYVEFSSPAVGTRGAVSLNDNTANERADLLTSGTDPRLVVHDGGAEQANINGGTIAAGARIRIAVRINTNNFAISVNGGAVTTDTSGALPTVDRLMLGRTQAGEYLNGRIARFTGWTGLLPDSTLQTLTQ